MALVAGLTVDIDCDSTSVRDVNEQLRALPAGRRARLLDPRGRHNLAVGLEAEVTVEVLGNAGYFLGGLAGTPDGGPDLVVDGFVGWSVGENLMGGSIRVRGSASQSAAASAHGGTVIIEGDASLRAGISLKGGSLAVGGDVAAMCGFMAQAGTILVGGSAGEGLGDSLYEAVIYVAGSISSLGADARVEDLTPADIDVVSRLAAMAGFDHFSAEDVTKVASARQLYHFSTTNHAAYA